jgi:hypothetical protein
MVLMVFVLISLGLVGYTEYHYLSQANEDMDTMYVGSPPSYSKS